MTLKRVWIVYLYAWREDEAVARCVRELSGALERRGFVTQVSGLKGLSPGTRSIRVLEEILFCLRLLVAAPFAFGRTDVVITLDAPLGIGLFGSALHVLSGGRIRHVSWILDLYSLQKARGRGIHRLRRRLSLESIKRSSEIVTIGACMARRVELISARPIRVIAIWQDLSRWKQAATGAGSRFVAVYAGTADKAHDLITVVDAASLLSSRPDIEIRIFGHGEAFVSAAARARELGLTNISFRPPTGEFEIRQELSAATVHLISLKPGATGTCVPSKTYAGMALAKPCVYIGDKDGQAALDILTAEAGDVIPVGDATGLADTFSRYAADPSLAALHGANGYAFVRDHRSLETQADAWSDLLSSGPERVESGPDSASQEFEH